MRRPADARRARRAHGPILNIRAYLYLSVYRGACFYDRRGLWLGRRAVVSAARRRAPSNSPPRRERGHARDPGAGILSVGRVFYDSALRRVFTILDVYSRAVEYRVVRKAVVIAQSAARNGAFDY